MVKLTTVALFSLAFAATSVAMATPVAAPEIDVASSVGAISLLAAAAALIVERSGRK